MKAALVVQETLPSVEANLAAMIEAVGQGAGAGADLVVFPEAALTGLINNDDPSHDLPLGQPVPGATTDVLAAAAREGRVYVATGILERDGDCLYDSAVLLSPSGDMVLKYRRIQPQWHGPKADPNVYRHGQEVGAAATGHGALVFLVCGDLFDDAISEQARRLAPDYVLCPLARNFADASFDQERWDREEESHYAARAALLGCTTLMVNQLDAPSRVEYPSFGGAMVVQATGEIVARWPLGKPGILYAELPARRARPASPVEGEGRGVNRGSSG